MPKGITITDRSGHAWTTTKLEHLALDINAHLVQAEERISTLCDLMFSPGYSGNPSAYRIASGLTHISDKIESAAKDLMSYLDTIRGEAE